MSLPNYEGIITVLTTPFAKTGEVDFSTLGGHIDFLLSNGITTLLEGGSTGEYYAQSLSEREKILEFVAERAGKKANLIAGTNSMRQDDTLALNTLAAKLGYQAVMLAAPPYSLPSTTELIAHFRRIAEATDLGIILYNFPARTGVDLDPEFLAGIQDLKNINGIKESSGSFARMIEHVLNFPNLQRVVGADDQALDAFLWGARSWISGASNFLPAEHVAIYKVAVVKRDFNLAHKMMTALLPITYILEQGGKFNQYVKYGTELAGFPVGEVRAPLLGLTESEKANFKEKLEAFKAQNIAQYAD
ncbi:dihydrodipicolinate synthase family protein [Paraburkholderia sabiae]|uniref:Dihydrodipicolinate synthase family protein n=1 Tax=Paraburkholderia sabiae TaxID=273251 RepID=A0ABU9QLY3_9BURK|nr:dihydrodipicolinate synthase family protein [Paraburkholderia sabiae]WJZ79270.1 dihydrodipicolinate synthase family protein [Paraburkholderia sabiae]CAD6560774.1 4-hydroxy-tetrahydrodipicolinate synthase [Paraburkholderia sabiae]